MRSAGASLLAVCALACGRADSPAVALARDPAAVQRGRLVFIGTCGAYCHALGSERRDAPDLFDCEWKHGGEDDDLFRVISRGVPETRMPAFEGALPDGERDLWKLIAFLRASSRCASGSSG
jgi:mono/diheme cytochrome c family protein